MFLHPMFIAVLGNNCVNVYPVSDIFLDLSIVSIKYDIIENVDTNNVADLTFTHTALLPVSNKIYTYFAIKTIPKLESPRRNKKRKMSPQLVDLRTLNWRINIQRIARRVVKIAY